jgi:hypothetical protein
MADKELVARLSELDEAKRTFVAAVLGGADDATAAEAAGVRRETGSRWACEHPGVIAALNAGRQAASVEIADRLLRLLPTAIEAIEEAVRSGDIRTALAVVRIAAPPLNQPARVTDPVELVEGQIQHAKESLADEAPARDEYGMSDPLDAMTRLTKIERAERLVLDRLTDLATV